MGAQWKHKGRIETSAKRGQLISKMVKEIIVASKTGDPDPDANARLRAAIEAAKKASVPRDNIERAIKKGAGLLEPVNYETITFEGFTPHKVPLIVECLSENRNRTSADMRVLFNKGSLGVTGSVNYMFTHLGMVVATPPKPDVDPEEAAIEANAQSVEKTDEGFQFLCEMNELGFLAKTLTKLGWQISASEFTWIPKSLVSVTEEQKKDVVAFLTDLDDNDDVHRIYTALQS